MNSKLFIVLGVVVALGIGVFIWIQLGDDGASIAAEGQEYHCCFDDTVVTIPAEDLMTLRNNGEAVLRSGPGEPPTRVKCTECGRLSCFKLDPATGAEIAIDPSWDLETVPDTNSRTGF